ncbi:2OG-Fe(II) oxygenase family oxidoreductase [Fonsecaea pedrosoi]|nr:2OG-Fe(II) oxygenase family oxidoreductase [Fonsecaea pedrosoi]
MISKTLPEVDHFVPVEPTKEKLDYADLDILDFSLYKDTPADKKELAKQVHKAMTSHGFFVIVNHGISEETIERIVDIGHTILSRTPQEEKERLRADLTGKGEYPGFKPRGIWKTLGGTPDRIEQFNVHRDMTTHEQPKTLEPYREEVQEFIDTVHKDILYKILRLFAISLEIGDEEFFVKAHSYNKHDESWFRWMEYYDIPAEGGADEKKLWLGGHQDLTSISLLFSQPMATLQVRDYGDESQWKFIPHIPGAIIVNAGEPMMWWTGNYYKAAVHRVVEPPTDQRNHDRSSVFYFVVPNDEVVINTLLEESPVLQRHGVRKWFKDGEAPTSSEWVHNRIKANLTAHVVAKHGEGKTSVQNIGTVTTTWYK